MGETIKPNKDNDINSNEQKRVVTDRRQTRSHFKNRYHSIKSGDTRYKIRKNYKGKQE